MDRVSDVIEYEWTEVGDIERDVIRKMHFDFVVTKGDRLTPHFVVEFDGPSHSEESNQARLDAVKNKFCHDAGLVMLRISSQELDPQEEVSLLDWLLERWVAWEHELPGIRGEIEDFINEVGPDCPAVRDSIETGIADPSIDPTFIFDLRHPYPAVLTIVHRLHRMGIITHRATQSVIDRITARGKAGRVATCVASELAWRPEADEWYVQSYQAFVQTSTPEAPSAFSGGEALYRTTQHVRCRWALPIGWNAREALGPDPLPGDTKAYLDWVRRRVEHLWPSHLPGTTPKELSEGLAEYLVLRDVESWAQRDWPPARE